VYIPYLLTERNALSPLLAGLSLTGGALAWSAAAGVQGRLSTRLSSITAVRSGAALVLAGTALTLAGVLLHAGPVLTVVAWIVAGSGMGLLSPRSSALTLAWSTPENQGFNSAAMTVADSFGSALALAVTGLLFTGAAGVIDPFAAVLILATATALAALLLSARVAPRSAGASAG
jgi:MFS family permease